MQGKHDATHVVNASRSCLAGQKGQCVEDDVAVLGLGLAGVEDGAIGVHQDHGGGEVEETRGQDEVVVGQVVRLTNHQPVDVEVKTVGVEHDEAIEAGGDGAEDEQQEDAELKRGCPKKSKQRVKNS